MAIDFKLVRTVSHAEEDYGVFGAPWDPAAA